MDKNYLDLMRGGDVLLTSKRIVDQAWDKGKVCRKIGGKDELLQTVSEILLKVLANKVIFDPGRGVSFDGFVMAKARWLAKENWMQEAPRIKRPEPAQPAENGEDGEDGDEGANDDDEKVEAEPLQTVAPSRGGADAQSESNGDHDGGWHAHHYTGGLLDAHLDNNDDGLTPAHQLIKQSDSAVLAGLLGCTNRTIINLRARASDRQAISKNWERLKNKICQKK